MTPTPADSSHTKPRLVFARGATGPAPFIHAPLGEEWITESQIAMQGGRVVVAALRVYPAQWTAAPERSHEQAGLGAEVPRGGVTARLLRQIKAGAQLEHFGRILRSRPHEGPLAEETAASLRQLVARLTSRALAEARWRSRGAIPRGGGRPGRRPLSDEVILRAAAAYVAACRRQSPRPIKEAARTLNMTEARLRDLVYRARNRRGFLERTRQGYGKGEWTARGRAMLKRLQRRSGRRTRR